MQVEETFVKQISDPLARLGNSLSPGQYVFLPDLLAERVKIELFETIPADCELALEFRGVLCLKSPIGSRGR